MATLSSVRAAFIDYHTNIAKYVDFSTLAEADPDYYCRGTFTIRAKTFEEVVGVKKLGEGCYANVYAINDKLVLKVIKSKDEGYASFIRVVKSSKRNPHFPRVYFSGIWAGKQVYVLERLASIDENSNYEDTFTFFKKAIKQSANPFISYANEHIKECAELCQEHGLLNDLHNGNIMFRNGVPVLTDPCAM